MLMVKTLYLKCKLTLVNLTPSICTQTIPTCDENSVYLPKPIEFYKGTPVVPVTYSMPELL